MSRYFAKRKRFTQLKEVLGTFGKFWKYWFQIDRQEAEPLNCYGANPMQVVVVVRMPAGGVEVLRQLPWVLACPTTRSSRPQAT